MGLAECGGSTPHDVEEGLTDGFAIRVLGDKRGLAPPPGFNPQAWESFGFEAFDPGVERIGPMGFEQTVLGDLASPDWPA